MTAPTNALAAPAVADLLLQAQYAAAAIDLARLTVGTAFLPDSLKVWRDPDKAKGRDADKTWANVDTEATVSQAALAIVKGTGLGFAWTEALEVIIVINNRPFISAIALRALILRTPFLRIEVTESGAGKAIVTGWRRDPVTNEWGDPQVSTWTMERARAAKFRGMTYEDSTWRTQPASMLLARATAECARWIGADIILGVPYVAEEADAFGDYDPEDAQTRAALPAGNGASAPPPRTRRRPPPPPAGAQTPPDGARPAGIEDDQRTQIHGDLTKLGITRAADQRAKINQILDLDGDKIVKRMDGLTRDQARQVVAALDAELRRKAQDASEGNGGPPAGDDDNSAAAGGASAE